MRKVSVMRRNQIVPILASVGLSLVGSTTAEAVELARSIIARDDLACQELRSRCIRAGDVVCCEIERTSARDTLVDGLPAYNGQCCTHGLSSSGDLCICCQCCAQESSGRPEVLHENTGRPAFLHSAFPY